MEVEREPVVARVRPERERERDEREQRRRARARATRRSAGVIALGVAGGCLSGDGESSTASPRPVSSARFAGCVTLSCCFVVPVTFALLLAFVGYAGLVADRLRLPRHALGACPRAPRRRGRSIRSRRARRRRRQPDRLSAARSSSRRSRSRSCPSHVASWLWFCLLGGVRRRGDVDRRRPRLALPRPRASRSPVVVHGLYYGNLTIVLLVLRRARLALPRPGARRRAGARRCGRGEALRLAARRLAAADAPVPRRRLGGGVGRGRPRPRRLGADRLRGASRLSGAARARCRTSTRSGASRSRRSPVRSALSCPAAVAVAAVAGVASASVLRPGSSRRRDGDRRAFALVVVGVRRRLADRLAELRRAPLRPDRDHVAAARAGVVLRLRDLARGLLAPKPATRRGLLSTRDVTEQAWAREPRGSGALVRGGVDGRSSPSLVAVLAMAEVVALDLEAAADRRASSDVTLGVRRLARETRSGSRRTSRRTCSSLGSACLARPGDVARAARRRSRHLCARVIGVSVRVALDPARRGRLLGAREEHRRRWPTVDPGRAGVRLGRGLSDADRPGVGGLRGSACGRTTPRSRSTRS